MAPLASVYGTSTVTHLAPAAESDEVVAASRNGTSSNRCEMASKSPAYMGLTSRSVVSVGNFPARTSRVNESRSEVSSPKTFASCAPSSTALANRSLSSLIARPYAAALVGSAAAAAMCGANLRTVSMPGFSVSPSRIL